LIVMGTVCSRTDDFQPSQHPQQASRSAPASHTLDVNTATAQQLEALPGIGPTLAAAIVAHRRDHGPFAEPHSLLVVPRLGPATLAKLQAHITCQGGSAGGKPAGAPQAISAGHRGAPQCTGHSYEPIFFPDDGRSLAAILEIINRARHTLDVAVYSITQDLLAEALEGAAAKGVSVRVLTDRAQAEEPNSDVSRLKQNGIPVRINGHQAGPKAGLMHHKFVIVDQESLLFGSFNWTGASINRTHQNLVHSRGNRLLLQRFTKEFERMWCGRWEGAPHGVFLRSEGSYVAALFFPDGPPSQNIELIEMQLKHAQRSIDVAVFTLTNEQLVSTLIERHRAGLRIRVIVDRRQATCLGSKVKSLGDAGVPVRMNANTSSIMHHKFAVMDDDSMINGSFNWTQRAVNQNAEDAVILCHTPQLAHAFAVQFERMWVDFH